MKKLILLMPAGLLAGCIGPAASPLNSVPVVSSSDKAGTVYIVRNGNLVGGGVNYAVTLDGREIFGINQYTSFRWNRDNILLA